VLWLFHHVLKTALYQLKAFELVPAQTERGVPSAALRGGASAALPLDASATRPRHVRDASTGVSAALLSAFAFGGWQRARLLSLRAELTPPPCGTGGWALALSPDDSVKCLGLVALAFSPVWLVIWSIGSSFVLRHADRITWGWFAPGVTTVLIDCLGQQQGVWRFPPAFLSGIGSGYLKLDIFLVYMVSTFAVTGNSCQVSVVLTSMCTW
jgi:hypothetical protein